MNFFAGSSSGVFFVACSRHKSRRNKLNGAAYEICLGEWQDTPPAIFLCVLL